MLQALLRWTVADTPPGAPTLDVVVRAHGAAVWGLCRRLTDEPEDAWQEVWLRVGRALPGFRPDGSATLRTFVLTIAHRHLVDRHRRQVVRGVPESADALIAPDIDPGHRVDADRRSAQLEAALLQLPVDQRRVVVLHHLHDVPLDVLAHNEGVAVGTIKSRLHRGRARLAELIGGEG